MAEYTTEIRNLGPSSPGVLVLTDSDGREFFIVNPSEIFTFKSFGRGYGSRGSGGLHVLWFMQHSPLRVGVFSQSLDDALEEAAGFAKDHWPGVFVDDEMMKEYYEDARKELGPDADEDEVFQLAEQDLTYTESGYIPSDDWGIVCDNVEGNPCDNDLMTAIAASSAIDAFKEAQGLVDVADVVRALRDTDAWESIKDEVVVFGPETDGVRALQAGSEHGELVSWDTDDKQLWRHEYLFWDSSADHPNRRVVVLDHDKVFP